MPIFASIAEQQQPIQISRPPADDEELYWTIRALWGVAIPRTPVCPNHRPPFEAFADAYFARSPVSVWKASRGFGGKTNTLGLLALSEGVLLGAQSTILGGSGAQSLRVHEATMEAWSWKNSPVGMLLKEPTKYDTVFKNGAWIRSLMASQASVRGPHPQRLRMDEIDEMDLPILEAAQGQPMAKRGIQTQTVFSSTHQYPDKTMSAILSRAVEKGWTIFEWCFLETSNPVDGWLHPGEIERKRGEVSAAMWDTEYELQEPNFEGRAIDTDSVIAAFEGAWAKDENDEIRTFKGVQGERIMVEAPIEHQGARRDKWPYVTSVDWAKEKDWTIISTFRTDQTPWRCVAWQRTGRLPWPVMVGEAEKQWRKYGGRMVHDSTGIGNVIQDYLPGDTRHITNIEMVGRRRMDIFSEYISAIEAGDIEYPFIEFAFNEHKYVTLEDLYGKGHAPDSVTAGALAWHSRPRHTRSQLVAPVSLKKTPGWFNV